jgi:hypothetical protein
MNDTLFLKYNGEKSSYQIISNGIEIINEKSFNKKHHYTIYFEEFFDSCSHKSSRPNRFSTLLCLSVFINVFMISGIIVKKIAPPGSVQFVIPILAIPFCTAMYFITREYSEKHIASSKPFYFLYPKKRSPEVDAFVKTVFEKRKEYFRAKYFILDPLLTPEKQTNNWMWLYENNLISAEEFQDIRDDLSSYRWIYNN